MLCIHELEYYPEGELLVVAIRSRGEVMLPSGLADELDWDRTLQHHRGAATRLAGIDVYHEFDWRDFFLDERVQFRNGQCLARRILRDCPEGKTPALLLIDRDDIEEGARQTASHYVVVLNLPRYLELAEGDAAVSYLARALGTGITRIRGLQSLADAQPDELRALINLRLEASDIAAWAGADVTRLAALRAIVAEDSSPEADAAQAIAHPSRPRTSRCRGCDGDHQAIGAGCRPRDTHPVASGSH